MRKPTCVRECARAHTHTHTRFFPPVRYFENVGYHIIRDGIKDEVLDDPTLFRGVLGHCSGKCSQKMVKHKKTSDQVVACTHWEDREWKYQERRITRGLVYEF